MTRKSDNDEREKSRNNNEVESSAGEPPADYEVGYGKPPVETRYKPGCSGNNKGRPAGSKNLKTLLHKQLLAPVIVREGDKKRTITKLEGVMAKQIESALRGNERASLALIKIAAQLGLLEDMNGTASAQTLSAIEKEIVTGLLQQLSGPSRSEVKGRSKR